MATLFPAPGSTRRPGRAFDLGIAGFAAAAVGFVCFAMPADLLGGLIGRTPLPSLVPAAAPPLGATARLLLMAAAAGLTFTLLIFALGALSQPAKPRRTGSASSGECRTMRSSAITAWSTCSPLRASGCG